jgi:hypothetical protein
VNKQQGRSGRLSGSARSILAYGVYIIVVGAAFLLFPNVGLRLLGLKTTTEVWIHIMSWFVIWVGIYYIVSALSESRAFIRATVFGRPTFIVFSSVIVALGMIEPVFLLFGAIDLATAVWTYLLMRSEKRISAADAKNS